MAYAVRVYFETFGNHRPSRIIGQVRRVADEFGSPGIVGKRGQTNARILASGYLRIVWPSRSLARRFQNAVEEFWGAYVSTRRFRV